MSILTQKPSSYRRCLNCGVLFLPFERTDAYCYSCMAAFKARREGAA